MTTTRLVCVALLSTLIACGSDDKGTNATVDAKASGSAAAKITVAGTAQAQGVSSTKLAGVTVAAYRNGDETTPLATTTSDTQGAYSMDIETGGVAVDGYIKATIASYLDTYLYPPAPLSEDFTNASINIVNNGTVTAFGSLCNIDIAATDGVVAVEVVNAAGTPVSGAAVASTPAASVYCYNGTSPLPDHNATTTAADGIAYMIAVNGTASVTATKGGLTFAAHTVNARPGTLTTTIIAGQ